MPSVLMDLTVALTVAKSSRTYSTDNSVLLRSRICSRRTRREGQ